MVRLKYLDEDEKIEMSIAPLIDCVFLLLIFFMVSAQLQKDESLIGMSLPGSVKTSVPVQLVDEQVVQISASGKIWLNGLEYDSSEDTDLPQLRKMLQRYRESSLASKQVPYITVDSDDRATHQRMMDVLNACHKSGIRHVTITTE
jgi:biopolymer transport protein ExbD